MEEGGGEKNRDGIWDLRCCDWGVRRTQTNGASGREFNGATECVG